MSVRDPAGVDSEEAELAHEQVVRRLEDLGDELAVLDRRELDLVVAFDLVAEAVDVVGLEAESARRSSSSLEADVLLGRDADDRHELAGGDRPVGGRRGGLGRDRLAFEVAAHERLVGLDDLLDDHLVGLGGVHRAVCRARRRGGLITSTTPEKLGPWPIGTKKGTHRGPKVSRISFRTRRKSTLSASILVRAIRAAEVELGRLLEDPTGIDLDARVPRDGQRRRSRRRPGRSGRCR